ncbi:unnamed protein product, partial [marine sediment metagenome]
MWSIYFVKTSSHVVQVVRIVGFHPIDPGSS